eukprot:Platyproteum_vivax@DN7399_c0_g1_i3.p1
MSSCPKKLIGGIGSLFLFFACVMLLFLLSFPKGKWSKNLQDYASGGVLKNKIIVDTSKRIKADVDLHLVYFISKMKRMEEFNVAMSSLAYYSAGYCNINLHFYVDESTKQLVQDYFADSTVHGAINVSYNSVYSCEIPFFIKQYGTFREPTANMGVVADTCLPDNIDMAFILDFDIIHVDNLCRMMTDKTIDPIKDPTTNKIVGLAPEAGTWYQLEKTNYPANSTGLNAGIKVINLKKAREKNWTQLVITTNLEYNKLHPSRKVFPFGDQCVFNRVNFMTKGEYVMVLPKEWNIQCGIGSSIRYVTSQAEMEPSQLDIINLHGAGYNFANTNNLSAFYFIFSRLRRYNKNYPPIELLNDKKRDMVRRNIKWYLNTCTPHCDFTLTAPEPEAPPATWWSWFSDSANEFMKDSDST